jgi:LPS sulfotransferase NodH
VQVEDVRPIVHVLPSALDVLRPGRAYIVCATPRSGSTLLCELLTATGVAGRPEEHIETLRRAGRRLEPREYFDGVEDPMLLALLGPPAPSVPDPAPVAEQLEWLLRAGSTANGVFGTKVMWEYFPDLQERLAELRELAPLDEAARLERLLGDVRFVHVAREDRVAQAVSMWRALQTGSWRSGSDDRCRPVYSFEGIDHLVRRIERHEREWAAWFAAHDIEPLGLGYDEIAADPPGAVRRVLALIGVAGEPPAEPPLRRQAGEQSAEWARRYVAERNAIA